MGSAHALRELVEEFDAGKQNFLKRREAERGEMGRQGRLARDATHHGGCWFSWDVAARSF